MILRGYILRDIVCIIVHNGIAVVRVLRPRLSSALHPLFLRPLQFETFFQCMSRLFAILAVIIRARFLRLSFPILRDSTLFWLEWTFRWLAVANSGYECLSSDWNFVFFWNRGR